MVVISLLITFLLTFIVTGFMLYVAMVTGIGPWVGPVIGILAQSLSHCFTSDRVRQLGLIITVSSSVGGIIGTAFGFSFPTWFFLDKKAFMYALDNKIALILIILSLVLITGLIGVACSNLFYKDLIEKEELPFPVGTMTYNAVTQHNPQDRYYLSRGILSYIGYVLLFTKRLLGKYALNTVYTFHAGFTSSLFTIPALTFDFSIVPLLIAIGFVAGSIMAVPLACGAILKMTGVTWLYNYYPSLPYNDFLFAFCSGIVVSGTIGGLWQQGSALLKNLYAIVTKNSHKSSEMFLLYQEYRTLIPLGILFVAYSYCYHFSFLSSSYLFVASLLCAYQISFIAGKIGLALLGRFATFVMVPGMILFGWNPLQVTIVATCVELIGGIAVDNLQCRKTLQLANMDNRRYMLYQYVALVSAACAIALFFYYFVTYYELGSSVLCAQRAQARALLLQVATVDMGVLVWGIIVGLLLKQFSCNPVLVLSGLLMPFSLLMPLIVGGVVALSIKKHKQYEPFFSGIYIANACGSILAMFL